MQVMPLELKTGKASFSAEHRGQVILYTMMMSELGQSVDSGLLLYLRCENYRGLQVLEYQVFLKPKLDSSV